MCVSVCASVCKHSVVEAFGQGSFVGLFVWVCVFELMSACVRGGLCV